MYVVDIDQQPVSTQFSSQTCLCVMYGIFDEQLLEVQQVDQIDTSASVGSVNCCFGIMLQSAIQG